MICLLAPSAFADSEDVFPRMYYHSNSYTPQAFCIAMVSYKAICENYYRPPSVYSPFNGRIGRVQISNRVWWDISYTIVSNLVEFLQFHPCNLKQPYKVPQRIVDCGFKFAITFRLFQTKNPVPSGSARQ